MTSPNSSINMWQYRDPSEISLTTTVATVQSSDTEDSTVDNTQITIPDPRPIFQAIMTQNTNEFQLFHDWLMAEPAENRRLYRDAFRALIIDINDSIDEVDEVDEVELEPSLNVDAEHEGELPSPPPPPPASNDRAPTQSPEGTSIESIQMPRARPHRRAAQPSATGSSRAASSPPTVGESLDMSGLWATTEVSSGRSREVSNATVIRHELPQLPDILYVGRTPPFWRWSDSDIPDTSIQQTLPDRPPARMEMREQRDGSDGLSERTHYGNGAVVPVGLPRELTIDGPSGQEMVEVAARRASIQRAARKQGWRKESETKRVRLRAFGRACMRKLKGE